MGGAIHNSGKTSIYDSEFRYNKVTNNGRTLDTHAPLNVYNCIIENNEAQWGGAIAGYTFEGAKEVYTDGVIYIENSVIKNNKATKTS